MIEDHLMVPTNEELKKWEDSWFDEEEHPDVLLIQAYQAGADAELEACCELLKQKGVPAWSLLRAARRPKPPGLKEQALEALSEMEDECLMVTHSETIRKALEQIDD